MKYDKIKAYNKSEDSSIEECLNCTKEKCNGKCNFQHKTIDANKKKKKNIK